MEGDDAKIRSYMCVMPHSANSIVNFRLPTNIGRFCSDGPVSDIIDIIDIITIFGSIIPIPFSRKII